MRLLCIWLLLAAWHRRRQLLLLCLTLCYCIVTLVSVIVRPHLVCRQVRPQASPTVIILRWNCLNGPTFLLRLMSWSDALPSLWQAPNFENMNMPCLRVVASLVGVLRSTFRCILHFSALVAVPTSLTGLLLVSTLVANSFPWRTYCIILLYVWSRWLVQGSLLLPVSLVAPLLHRLSRVGRRVRQHLLFLT